MSEVSSADDAGVSRMPRSSFSSRTARSSVDAFFADW